MEGGPLTGQQWLDIGDQVTGAAQGVRHVVLGPELREIGSRARGGHSGKSVNQVICPL